MGESKCKGGGVGVQGRVLKMGEEFVGMGKGRGGGGHENEAWLKREREKMIFGHFFLRYSNSGLCQTNA